MKYLPPELLLDIFSRAVPASPCLVPLEWNERKQSLSSFMLVTKSWTSAAQEVLFTEFNRESIATSLDGRSNQQSPNRCSKERQSG